MSIDTRYTSIALNMEMHLSSNRSFTKEIAIKRFFSRIESQDSSIQEHNADSMQLHKFKFIQDKDI